MPVAWPSGLRRWFKAPVSSEAWVRIPPLPHGDFDRTLAQSPSMGTFLESASLESQSQIQIDMRRTRVDRFKAYKAWFSGTMRQIVKLGFGTDSLDRVYVVSLRLREEFNRHFFFSVYLAFLRSNVD